MLCFRTLVTSVFIEPVRGASGNIGPDEDSLYAPCGRPAFRRRDERFSDALSTRAFIDNESDNFDALSGLQQHPVLCCNPAQQLRTRLRSHRNESVSGFFEKRHPRLYVRRRYRVTELGTQPGDLGRVAWCRIADG